MSIESARSFIELMKMDKEFAKKITECKNEKNRMAFSKEAGFDFTAIEFKEASKMLNDDDLEKVSGGIRPDHEA
ncbi:MAG: Nif11-like leader peptide family natural product precursor [Syntrophomonas sp.]